jgi:HlyD family secretion protein
MPGQIFRQESLQRLQSPEELDQLLVVVNRKAWFVLLTLMAVCAAAIVWSIVGKIPVRVEGVGVLVNPGNVKSLQSPASGQITAVEVRVGQHVKQGSIFARLDQPDLRKELQQLRAKREDTVAFQKTTVEMDERRRKLETSAFERQRGYILEQVAKIGNLSEQLGSKSKGYIEEQRRNIDKTRALTNQLNKSLTQRLETLRQLKIEGLSSQDLVLNAQSSVTDGQIRMANLDVQEHEMQLQDVQRRQTQLEHENRRSDLALQLMQLDISAQRLLQELTQNQKQRENDLRELDNSISRLELRLEHESKILCDCQGTILEVAVQPGQVLGMGLRVGTIEMDDPNGHLTNLAFFSVREGKRIYVGDQAHVTPTTVQREREGSMIGTVRRVSPFPITQESVINNVGNEEIARALLQQGGAIEVEVELERDPNSFSGFRWTSKGPEKKFSAGTTTSVRVTIEQRTPITYLLPILRTWFMGEEDVHKPAM